MMALSSEVTAPGWFWVFLAAFMVAATLCMLIFAFVILRDRP